MENTGTTISSPRVGHSISEVMDMLGISKTTFHRIKQEPGFPAPSFYVGKRPRWTLEAIVNWANGGK